MQSVFWASLLVHMQNRLIDFTTSITAAIFVYVQIGHKHVCTPDSPAFTLLKNSNHKLLSLKGILYLRPNPSIDTPHSQML